MTTHRPNTHGSAENALPGENTWDPAAHGLAELETELARLAAADADCAPPGLRDRLFNGSRGALGVPADAAPTAAAVGRLGEAERAGAPAWLEPDLFKATHPPLFHLRPPLRLAGAAGVKRDLPQSVRTVLAVAASLALIGAGLASWASLRSASSTLPPLDTFVATDPSALQLESDLGELAGLVATSGGEGAGELDELHQHLESVANRLGSDPFTVDDPFEEGSL